ncbi:recombinase family protein [Streptomyces sp. PTM05]|uniref:Recombinase family protein n=1 Tax=Streptantibioticus parmotrematis TaxID=2873249 RepID=A0ABS7QUM9_9ACTN|nr:recombinase family protein [Streptantibioticus parmotrematis]MBY8886901.1 recombinase family protein [Streptantibioticus parmotrematis]
MTYIEGKNLVERARWGRLEGMRIAALVRLSTEEADGQLDDSPEAKRFLTGRDIKSTAEQTIDAKTFVEERGGRLIHVYVEPDTSAWKRRRVQLPDGNWGYRVVRPVYKGALDDLRKGVIEEIGEEVDGLVVYDIDRLTRDNRDLEDAIDVVVHSFRPILDITGTLDLLTDNGRVVARIAVAIANKQSADTSRRVARKHQALQRNGIPGGGPRPYGWQEDRRTKDPEESARMRETALDLIGRRIGKYGAIARWNQAGYLSANGKKWTENSFVHVMTSPRIAGLRARAVYRTNPVTGKQKRVTEPVYDEDGNYVKGQQEAILTVAEWKELCPILMSAPTEIDLDYNTRRYLGTGTLRCGKCNAKLRTTKAPKSRNKSPDYFIYQCAASTTGRGCGGVAIPGPETDELVRKLVIAKHLQEKAARAAEPLPEKWPKEQELKRVEEDMQEAEAARSRGKISASLFYRMLAKCEARQSQLMRERNAWERKNRPIRPGFDMEKEWDRPDITMEERRAYLGRAFAAIIVLPVGKGARVPVRNRLVPVFAD